MEIGAKTKTLVKLTYAVSFIAYGSERAGHPFRRRRFGATPLTYAVSFIAYGLERAGHPLRCRRFGTTPLTYAVSFIAYGLERAGHPRAQSYNLDVALGSFENCPKRMLPQDESEETRLDPMPARR